MRSLGKLLLIFCLFLSGCTALVSIRDTNGVFEGYTYNLPKSLLKITVRRFKNEETGTTQYILLSKKNKANGVFQYTPEIESVVIPDSRHKYAIGYIPSAFSDDRLCISRTNSGLLHDVQFAADDRTPQMIFNISRFLAGAVSGVSLQIEKDKNQPFSEYSKTIDPFRRKDWEAFNHGLRAAFNDPDLSINFKRFHKMARQSGNATGERGFQRRHPSCEEGYICYRSRLKLPVDLMKSGRKIDAAYADVINPWDIGVISVKRAFLVRKITKLRFDKGVLAAAVIKKPSEVEELTLLPLNVISAILSVPTNLWRGAFSDYGERKATAEKIADLKTQLTKVQNSYSTLLLQGGAGTVSENGKLYTLNCGASRRSDSLNWTNNFKQEGTAQ